MRNLLLILALLAPVGAGAQETAFEALVADDSRRTIAGEATVSLVYDDGEADNGIQANSPNSVRVAMRFDAGAPGFLTQVQFCLQRPFSTDSSSGPVAVSVYSVGGGGGPGALIASGTTNVTGFPTTGIAGAFRAFALSPAPAVPASFFVGLTLDSITSDFWACTDEDGVARPVFGSANNGPWFDIRSIGFPNTKALMVRATVETTTGPPPPPPGDCVEDGATACLLNGRFRATVRYRNAFDDAPADSIANRKDVTGFASPEFETEFFYLFASTNIEVIVKMMDAGGRNAAEQLVIAVLTGTATPLRVEVTITDTLTGAQRTYVSPFGSQRGVTDFTAFIK